MNAVLCFWLELGACFDNVSKRFKEVSGLRNLAMETVSRKKVCACPGLRRGATGQGVLRLFTVWGGCLEVSRRGIFQHSFYLKTGLRCLLHSLGFMAVLTNTLGESDALCRPRLLETVNFPFQSCRISHPWHKDAMLRGSLSDQPQLVGAQRPVCRGRAPCSQVWLCSQLTASLHLLTM